MASAAVLCGAAPSLATAGTVTVSAAPSQAAPLTVVETFSYTGAAQTWTVPVNATATLAVTPGAPIEVYVGGQGRDILVGQGAGGFNGGSAVGGMSGGGASDVVVEDHTLQPLSSAYNAPTQTGP